MKTQEQDVLEERAKLAILKNEFLNSLNRYIESDSKKTDLRDNAILSVQRNGNAYFNHAESFVGNSDLLGAHNNSLWVQGFAEDCSEILGSMPEYFSLLRQGFKNSTFLSTISCEPGKTAFSNMQRMVVTYLNADISADLEKQMVNANLPIYGFKNKAKLKMDVEKILAFIFGVVFICVSIALALFQPNPTSFQYTVFRTVLALAASGIGAVIPGFLHVQHRNWIRAGGALAVFFIVYLLVPGK